MEFFKAVRLIIQATITVITLVKYLWDHWPWFR